MTDDAPAPIPAELAAGIARDPWTRALGIEYLTLARGYGKAALTLADATFAAACNSHGEPAVALNVSISYIASAEPGARLVAEAREVRQGRRAGFYDVTVRSDADGPVIASAHCVAHRVTGDAGD